MADVFLIFFAGLCVIAVIVLGSPLSGQRLQGERQSGLAFSGSNPLHRPAESVSTRPGWHRVFLDWTWPNLSLWSNIYQLTDPSPALTIIYQLNYLDLHGFELITVGDILVLLPLLSQTSAS